MSMYGDYLKERLGDGIVERDEGFATYRYLYVNNNTQVYIVDLYVKPEFRKTKIATEMANAIAEIARKEGATEMIGTVVPSANGATESLKVLLGYGMTLKSASENLIIFTKEI